MADFKVPTRKQLSSFLPDHESIKQFEALFDQVGVTTPGDLETLYRLVEESSTGADTANATAQQALAALQRIADSLELLTKAPSKERDNYLRADVVEFDDNNGRGDAVSHGQVSWSQKYGTVAVGINTDVTAHVSQDIYYRVRNQTGSTITKGTIVMFDGTLGASNVLLITPAVADGSSPAKYILGAAAEDIPNGTNGYAVHFGEITGIETNGSSYGEVWVDGEILYADPATPGTLTNVLPQAPNLKTTVATVINAHPSNGSLFISVRSGSILEENQNVELSGLAAGQTIVYDATQGRFENANLTAGANVNITNADASITISVPSAAPSGTAGGVLSGTYPNPGFAVDMATQAELDAHATNTTNPHAVTKTQVGLGNVENTALSTWAGSTNITTLGTIASGAWNASTITVAYGGTGKTSWTANAVLYATGATTLTNSSNLTFNGSEFGVNCTPPGTVPLRVQANGFNDAGFEVQRTSATNIALVSYDRSGANFTSLQIGSLDFKITISGIDKLKVDSNGDISVTAGSTAMTNGFIYIPAASGAPTGAPTGISGHVPLYYDTTNNDFYVYNGAWKKVALA